MENSAIANRLLAICLVALTAILSVGEKIASVVLAAFSAARKSVAIGFATIVGAILPIAKIRNRWISRISIALVIVTILLMTACGRGYTFPYTGKPGTKITVGDWEYTVSVWDGGTGIANTHVVVIEIYYLFAGPILEKRRGAVRAAELVSGCRVESPSFHKGPNSLRMEAKLKCK